jgi:hypothetical protein
MGRGVNKKQEGNQMAITKEHILLAERGLIEGIRKSDVQYLNGILHDDLSFMVPNGQIITKQMDLDSHKRGDMVVESLTPTFEDIKIFGDCATVVVVYETKGTMLGNPVEGRFRYIRMWKMVGDGPKIIGGACIMLG